MQLWHTCEVILSKIKIRAMSGYAMLEHATLGNATLGYLQGDLDYDKDFETAERDWKGFPFSFGFFIVILFLFLFDL